MIPFLTNDSPWFSFVGHPRHTVDLDRIGGTALLRRYSVSEEDFLKKIGLIPPVVIGRISFGSSAVTGEVISVMCMPNLMIGPGARQSVLEGVRLAISRGARVIGLGALTAPATGAGVSIVKDIPTGTTLTTGNAYTAAVAFNNVMDACRLLSLPNPHVAVLGCTGSVGFALTHLLAREGYRLTLIGRTEERVKALFSDLRDTQSSGSLTALSDANIVVVLTNDISATVKPELLSSESVVIDVAQPANVRHDEYSAFYRRGIRIFEGGLVRIPGYSCTFDFGLGTGVTFACLAETYLFSRDGIAEHSVGRASPDLAVYLNVLAARHGVQPCALDCTRSSNRQPITEYQSTQAPS